ncbi:MAG: hypothetical protein DRI79_11930 [Chloroflexi bacterium]|nr:MAG: hypothetical protein DRI79_11930 [Chloroflexota bacterium]
MSRVEHGHDWVFEHLAAYMDGDLNEEETREVAEHLAACTLCQRRLNELRSVEDAYASGPEEKPSAAYRAALVERVRAARGPRRYDLVTVGDLADLSDFRSEHYPVLSLYLDVSPPERENRKHIAKFKRLSREAEERLGTASRPYLRAFRSEVERLRDWLEHAYDGTGRGLSVFTSSEHGLWYAFRLPVTVRDRLIVSDRPYIRPLVTLADEYERYAVLLVDKKIARLFMVYMGEIEEYTEVLDEVVPRPKAGGWSAEKYQRHHDMHVLWHVKNAVEVLKQFYPAEGCDWLVIGGTEESLAELRAQLPKALREHLAGELSISLKAGADEILARVLEIERATERRVEAERVERLITTALKGGPAVLGLADTLVAIVEGRVMMLILEADFREPGFECENCHYLTMVERPACPLCGATMIPQVDIVERAVERALDQQAQIEVLRGKARARLTEYGHIGALLRY